MDESNVKHILKLTAAGLIGLLPIVTVLKQRLSDEDRSFIDKTVIKMKGGDMNGGDVSIPSAGGNGIGIGVDTTTAETLNIHDNVLTTEPVHEKTNESISNKKGKKKVLEKPDDSPDNKAKHHHPQIKPLTHYSMLSTFLHGSLSGAGVVVTEIILVYYLSRYFPKPGTNNNNNNNNSAVDPSTPLIIPAPIVRK